MGYDIDKRLGEIRLELPEPVNPIANYQQTKIVRDFVYISGQLPFDHQGNLITGPVGQISSLEQAKAAARLCAVNALAQLRAAINGDWERVESAVKLTGYVSSTANFDQHSAVIDGASELIVQVMGRAGDHTRVAVGVSSLPRGAAVELDAIFCLR